MRFLFAFLFLCLSCGSVHEVSHSQPVRFLKNVKKTTSISSNQYAEVVLDPAGNAYIACFYTAKAREDYVYIVKLDSEGNKLWEKGTETKGRATCLAIDTANHIWVGGFFEDFFKIGGYTYEKTGRNYFIAELNQDGECLRILTTEGTAIPFDLEVNASGQMMVFGIMADSLQIDQEGLKIEGQADGNFLAFFDTNKTCQWLKPIQAGLIKIKASNTDDFYVGGAFYGHLNWEGNRLQTTSDWDQDGLFLKINPKGNTDWIRQIGNEGMLKKGYRTFERIVDFTFGTDNEPIAIAFFQKESQEKADLHLLKYNDSGKVTADKIIRSQIAPSNATIGYDGIAYWITANDLIQKTGFPDKRQSFFLSLNQKLQPVTTILASNGLNTAVRSQYNRKGATIMSGHYQDLLQIGKDSIQNDGHHALFVVGF